MGLGSIAGAIGGAIANPMVAGAALSGAGTLYQNYANKKAAQRQMDFQSHMSNTAYQRAMADMKKAGLNPILAGKLGGASTPGGAMPVLHDPVTPAVNTGLQAMQASSNVDVNTAKEQLTYAEVALKNVDTVIRGNFVPTSEALGLLGTEIANLARAAAVFINSNGSPYEAMLGTIKDKVKGVAKTLYKKGVDAKKFLDETFEKASDVAQEGIEFMEDSLQFRWKD